MSCAVRVSDAFISDEMRQQLSGKTCSLSARGHGSEPQNIRHIVPIKTPLSGMSMKRAAVASSLTPSLCWFPPDIRC